MASCIAIDKESQFKLLTIFAKNSIVDVRMDSKYASSVV